MKSISLKLICAITACSLIAAIVAGGIVLHRSSTFLTNEISEKILTAAENHANDFSSTFNHTEGLVDSLAANISVTFDPKLFNESPTAYMNSYKASLSRIIEKTVQETNIAHGLYATFNPELTPQHDEVWYAYENGKVMRINPEFEVNLRDFSLPAADDMLYFFMPYLTKESGWVGPYLDRDISINIISYSAPIYVEDLFIGIAGADITTEDTLDLIDEMEEYQGGYAFLLDENLNFIVHPNYINTDNLESVEEGAFSELAKEIKGKESGVFYYHFIGEKRLAGFSTLDNGWSLVITQPTSQVFAPISTLNNVMLLIGVTLFFFIIAFAILFSFVFFKPIAKKQNTLEEQNREKEVLLIYQSRQAKMGEMLGNIAHQWKQPLNSINLILVNLLDAYHYGELDEVKLNRSIGKVDNIVGKLSDTIVDFTEFLKPTKEKTEFLVSEYVDVALSLMEESINLNQIQVDFYPQPPLLAYGYPNEFTHVLFNILDNARDAIVESNSVEKRISIDLFQEDDLIYLNIINTGNSISGEILSEIFTPYFTTKEKKHGTGIGLYISKIIIERMNGQIVISNITEGVCCSIILPSVPLETIEPPS